MEHGWGKRWGGRCGSHATHYIRDGYSCQELNDKLSSSILLDNCIVEMAGIEPASERFDPRKSTSVVGRGLSSQRSRPTGTLCDQPLVFRTCSGVVCGTPPLFRPIRHPAEEGAGGRALIKGERLLCHRLCSEGHSSVGSAIGT
jgi:hypothetical protein